MKNGGIYFLAAQKEFPRLLSMEDRDACSRTFGCFDRTYWSWKFTDFPGSRYQEAIYALGVLADNPNNKDHETAYFNRLWDAASEYWMTLQHKDGSFDEAYPWERSFAATAFTTFYIGNSMLERKDKISKDLWNKLIAAVSKACDWLCKNQENHGVLSNHIAVGAAALEAGYLLTKKQAYRERSEFLIKFILGKQSKEGWYEEYGGADPGYQTHTTFYLGAAWLTNQKPEVLESLNRSMRFLQHFITPTGALGGIYASRNTEFYMPAGFEMLASYSDVAREIAHTMRPFFQGEQLIGLAEMDPQNFMPLLNNYLFAAQALDKDNKASTVQKPILKKPETSDHIFPEAGLRVVKTPSYMAIISLFKGGVIQAYFYDKDKMTPYIDGGCWLELKDGRKYHSQILNRRAKIESTEDKITITTNLGAFNQKIMTPFLFLNFRIFTIFTAWMPKLSYAIKKLLVFVLVNRKSFSKMDFTRSIELKKESIQIRDSISNIGNQCINKIQFGGKFSGIHMGSSRYFSRDEIDNQAIPKIILKEELQTYYRNNILTNEDTLWP